MSFLISVKTSIYLESLILVRMPCRSYEEDFENYTTSTALSTAVEHVTCDFSGYNGNGRRIAFRNTLSNGKTWDYSYFTMKR